MTGGLTDTAHSVGDPGHLWTPGLWTPRKDEDAQKVAPEGAKGMWSKTEHVPAHGMEPALSMLVDMPGAVLLCQINTGKCHVPRL